MRRWCLALVPVLPLLTACAPGVASRQAAILGGEIANGDPAVGMLEFSTGRFGTGTLIAPNVVLTAAHVVGGDILAFYTGEGIPSPQLDNTVSSPTMVRHAIKQKQTHPAYGCDAAGTCDSLGGFDLDIGLVELGQPITDIEPYAASSDVAVIGDDCRAVGFGLYLPEGGNDSDMATVKQKRQANVHIIDLDDVFVHVEWSDGITDHGDSGGPLFCNELLVATTTQHTDGELAAHRVELDTRVDRAMPWISATIAAWNPGVDLGTPSDLAPTNDLPHTPPSHHGCAATGTPDVTLGGGALLGFGLIAARRRRARRR